MTMNEYICGLSIEMYIYKKSPPTKIDANAICRFKLKILRSVDRELSDVCVFGLNRITSKAVVKRFKENKLNNLEFEWD